MSANDSSRKMRTQRFGRGGLHCIKAAIHLIRVQDVNILVADIAIHDDLKEHVIHVLQKLAPIPGTRGTPSPLLQCVKVQPLLH